MVSFLALYRGKSIVTAQLIAVSTDPHLVGTVAASILASEHQDPEAPDPAISSIVGGRREALKLILGDKPPSQAKGGRWEDE